MPSVIPLTIATPADASIIGNKAARLAELIRADYPVPEGYCITTEAFAEWRKAGTVSIDLHKALLGAFQPLSPPVAVRSSSPAEDRAEASFAGQYETVLGVRTAQEFIQAVETCWRSASSENARAYLQDNQETNEIEMAVLVQELVPASVAGVLFTMHPVSQRLDLIVINANFELGDSVVSGRADPDTYVVSKDTGKVVEKKIGTKKIVSRLMDNGVHDVDSDVSIRGKPCLEDRKLQKLAELARKLEAHFDLPMDIEWAFEGDKLHVLQARPITTAIETYYSELLDQWARARGLVLDPDAIWSRGSPLSGLAVSPLYYSEMAAFFSDMFPRVAQLKGETSTNRQSFRYFRGYTYSDVTFASTADPSGTPQPLAFLSKPWRLNLLLGLRYPRSYAVWTNIDSYRKRWSQEWLPAIEAARPNYTMAGTAQVREFIELIEVQRRERSIFAALGVGYASDLLGLLAHLLLRWAPDVPNETIGLLTSGVPESLTHEENIDLGELVNSADGDNFLHDALVTGNYKDLETTEAGRRFLDRVDALRSKRPHRGCSDRDILQPRWGDSRNLLLAHLRSILSLGNRNNSETAHLRAVSRREACEQEVFNRIGRGLLAPIKRRVFSTILRATQRYWIHRDNQRHSFDVYFYELRQAYLALGALLVEESVFSDLELIFFAGKHEIYDYLDGDLSNELLRQRVEWRRSWWLQVKDEDPLPSLKGNLVFEPESEIEIGETDLVGMGGAPGIARGPARLIRSLDQLGLIQEGEIVVTHAIDPAWTPVFGLIGGVISEEGGILSHATVLGREYGLPVIISVARAASILNDGDMVEINGTTGAVRLLDAVQP